MRLFLFAVLGFWAASVAVAQQTWTGVVASVVDGDTVWVKPSNGGKPQKIRILGIDAPEICQMGGELSQQILNSRVRDRVVSVAPHADDTYGRTLGRIYLNGKDVGADMVRSGYAWSYRYQRSMGPYAAEEKQARAKGMGLFSNANAQEPRSFRKQYGTCHEPKARTF